MLPHDLLDLSEPRFRRTDFRPFLPMTPFRDRLERALQFCDSASNSHGKVLGNVPLSNELAEHLLCLLEVLRRLVPEPPIVSQEIRDMPCVDGFPIAIRFFSHLVTEKDYEQIHEVLPTNPVDLQLFEDQVRERNGGVVELQSSVPGFLPEEYIMAELEFVEEDIDMKAIAALVIDEPSIAEEAVDHVVRLEPQAVEDPADGAALGPVPQQIEIREEGRSLSHPSDAAVERKALGSVERVCIDRERAENAKDRALRLSRVDDRPGFPEKLVIAERYECGWICHDGTEESMRPSKGPSWVRENGPRPGFGGGNPWVSIRLFQQNVRSNDWRRTVAFVTGKSLMRGPRVYVLPGSRGGEYGRSRCICETQ